LKTPFGLQGWGWQGRNSFLGGRAVTGLALPETGMAIQYQMTWMIPIPYLVVIENFNLALCQ
jgi:hypothetical protein